MLVKLVLLLVLALGGADVVSSRTYQAYFIEYENQELEAVRPWPRVQLLDVTWSVKGQNYAQGIPEILSCRLIENPDHVLKKLKKKNLHQTVLRITSEKMEYILHHCSDAGQLKTEDFLHRSIIWPGTKWCGPGNISENFDDLGEKRETDICCRDHDTCDDILKAGETKYGLTNDALTTRLNCKCDEDFRVCLMKVNTQTSNAVGEFYFNIAQNKCYKMEHPQTKCLRWGGLLQMSCQEYELDVSKPKIWQFFDAVEYRKPKL
ncbi:phospholipase A2-like [Limulus polyphemus]|uniref:Phospholipase A2-like n=1 Tax=Limulus polyphemus TaxID=6850 RepID=A0ABM1TRK6_LIMPO|nr:phospholipase A2-like [Limulus polyphemus]